MTNGKIEFTYTKKYEVKVIESYSDLFGPKSTKIKPTNEDNMITYDNLNDGAYSVSRFGKAADYVIIENGENREVSEVQLGEYFNGTKNKINKIGAVIKFPYAKEHWLAEITGKDAIYKLERNFIKAEEIEGNIVYAGLSDGIYQFSKFGKPGKYIEIKDGVISDIPESEVMNMFDAPENGMSTKERIKKSKQMGEDGYGDVYEFSLDMEYNENENE